MAKSVMRITLKAYEHELVDASAAKIIETAKKNGSKVSGPVPLPTKKEVVTILRATHKYKDSREQFEQRTHKRLIDIAAPTPGTIESLQRLEMPAGVFIDLKMLNKYHLYYTRTHIKAVQYVDNHVSQGPDTELREVKKENEKGNSYNKGRNDSDLCR